MAGIHVSTTINGDPVEFVCQPGEVLLDVLRNRIGLTGAKEGCGTGDCAPVV
ncbi:MAG: 2Fe-2S iron-sulfur cluster-binding protein [Pseudomonadales bacterium]